ncbi:hypothetical protein CA839_05285 [Fusobacterium polymorphum]|uniref:Uncharacterized protein n=1 Tax=Fusobacterium nucleatum subsp. polymorphum TaxID=76857 RepID=A0A246EFP4_FUSNP|nr:hypothetical protein [Fusobacterium polymorphum]OWP25383.1 hypothetical protein CA839_05285 [Fusobacterium polymorphum]
MESQDREFEQKVEKNLNYLLEMCVNELNHEREKKQSLENRASWGITLLGVIITVLFENPDLSRLFTYPILFKNYFLLSIIILLAIATLFFLTLVIITEKKFHSIFFDDSLEKNFLTDDEIKPISSVIDYYEKTCKVYKKNNQKKAFYLNISLLLNLILFIFLIFFRITL